MFDAELKTTRFIARDGGRRRFSHRVVAHGIGLKTQPRFAQDPKLPQLRQQAANSA
jgi:hypothetical protein